MRPAVMEACNSLNLAPVWVTPFLRITQSVLRPRDFAAFLAPFEPARRPVVLQLMGCDAALLAAAAVRGLEAGAAGIDLNCGCPSRQVIAHGAGAGALREWERTPRLVEALRKALPDAWFSIKMRLGFDCPAEASGWLKRLENAGGPEAFFLHYRTVREGYAAAPGRTERLRAAAQTVKHTPVFGNGDIQTADEARGLCAAANLKGAMIGRGFWRDPWILRRLNDPSPSDPTPEAAAGRLWDSLANRVQDGGGGWTRGAAIELASLILGGDSPAARKLKYDR